MALSAIAAAVTSCTITFHGAACQAIQDGTVVAIDIVYGCNMPPVG